MLTKTEIEELKKRLPRGYFKKISERAGLSTRSVSNFFEGKIYRPEIHQAVLDEIEDWETVQAELQERQKSLSHAK